MLTRKPQALARREAVSDPFAALRQITSEMERLFQQPPFFNLPPLRFEAPAETGTWLPQIDVFEKDNRLVTKVDLPGLKKEDVKVEVTDGYLAISGGRKTESEEKKENFYRTERAYGSFHRAVPLPEGVKLEDVKATFADGVLEVSVPLPARAEAKVRTVAIEEAPKAKAAAA